MRRSFALLPGTRTHAARIPPAPLRLLPRSLAPSRPLPRRRWQSGSAPEPVAKPSLRERMKLLLREHGKAALVVYLGLSLVDFGLLFGLIFAVGADSVRQAEDWVLERLDWRRRDAERPSGVKGAVGDWAHAHLSTTKGDGLDVERAVAGERDSAHRGEMGSALWTTALLAYTIHKTLFLPIRIGATAWLTPPIVRCAARASGALTARSRLRAMGYSVGRAP